jgi:hypothetical protein
MSIEEVSAEQLAQVFHHYHQAFGPDFGCESKSNAGAWEQLPQEEKSRMVAAARLAYWNWPTRPESERTQSAISRSLVRLNGAAEMGQLRWGGSAISHMPSACGGLLGVERFRLDREDPSASGQVTVLRLASSGRVIQA